jgi:hypothetical protein
MTARQADPTGDVEPRGAGAPPAVGVGRGGVPGVGARPGEGVDGPRAHDIVDEVGEGSFPSSDPPSWSRAVAS